MMVRILMIAAIALGCTPPTARADDRYDVTLTTTGQSAVSGTTDLKTIRVQSDLGPIEIPIERIVNLSKVGDRPIQTAEDEFSSVPLHEINTTRGSRIRGVIVKKTFTLTCEFGDLEVSWDQVATLSRPSQEQAVDRGQARAVPDEAPAEEPGPTTTPPPGIDE